MKPALFTSFLLEVTNAIETDFNKVHRCQDKVGDFSFNQAALPKNREHLFDYCLEHAGNTCCMVRDIDKIRARIDFISQQENFKVAEKCLQVTEQILCSVCDADVGTGRRDGICQPQCNDWFDACKRVKFCDVPGFEKGEPGSLDFCTDYDVDISKQLQSITDKPAEFCMMMNFPVPERKAPYCYNGVPTASIVKAGTGRSGWDRPPNKSIVEGSLSLMFKGAIGGFKVLSIAIVSIVIIGLFILLCMRVIETQDKETATRRKQKEDRALAKKKAQQVLEQKLAADKAKLKKKKAKLEELNSGFNKSLEEFGELVKED